MRRRGGKRKGGASDRPRGQGCNVLNLQCTTVHYLILYMVVLYKSRTAWDSVDPTVGQCKIR